MTNGLRNANHKFYLESKVKLHNKQELVNCVKKFWERKVTPEKRAKYIYHVLQKVVPAVMEVRGAETKYYKGSVRSHRALLHLVGCLKWLF